MSKLLSAEPDHVKAGRPRKSQPDGALRFAPMTPTPNVGEGPSAGRGTWNLPESCQFAPMAPLEADAWRSLGCN